MAGIGISHTKEFAFSRSGGGAPSVLQTWYDSLSVKPSAGLWTDLKTMADGMNSDGDWGEIDFFPMIAAMETDEQRLRPLKTTSGLDMTSVASPTLDVNGVTGNGTSSYLKSGWNPSVNKIAYTLNTPYFAVYHSSQGTNVNRRFFGTSSYFYMIRGANGTTSNINFSSGGGIVHTLDLGYKAAYFLPSDVNLYLYHSGILDSLLTNTPSFISNEEVFICGQNNGSGAGSLLTNATIRCLVFGNSLINNTNVRTRLNTFFAARGLATF